jgi:hypothetical protein
VGEAVVGEGGGGGTQGVGEQRAGGEGERVHLEEAAGEWEVLPEEALEDGERIRRHARFRKLRLRRCGRRGTSLRAEPDPSPSCTNQWFVHLPLGLMRNFKNVFVTNKNFKNISFFIWKHPTISTRDGAGSTLHSIYHI